MSALNCKCSHAAHEGPCNYDSLYTCGCTEYRPAQQQEEAVTPFGTLRVSGTLTLADQAFTFAPAGKYVISQSAPGSVVSSERATKNELLQDQQEEADFLLNRAACARYIALLCRKAEQATEMGDVATALCDRIERVLAALEAPQRIGVSEDPNDVLWGIADNGKLRDMRDTIDEILAKRGAADDAGADMRQL